VDWLPWGQEAFELAREQDKPVFLSVGYSSCHWCHVMAHESFEDEQTAALMNERFVNVKVDREERPDVDQIYMDAVTAMTGHGGWPMSVWLTPDGKPFHAGTYFPNDRRQGMPSFTEVIEAVSDAWDDRRDEVLESASSITERLERNAATHRADSFDPSVADEVTSLLGRQVADRHHGGFGRAPKFPQAMLIEWLLDHHAATGDQDALVMAGQALDAMARGGIHDQIGGGFARYATDAAWLVPHFEKMLYDNALLAPAYAKAWVATGDDRFARTARSTCDYLLRELRHGGGAFFSATDADSEGIEGKFFVWSLDELTEVLESAGLPAQRFATFFGATDGGNWEGSNILHEPVPREAFVQEHGLDAYAFEQDLASARAALYERRSKRVPPGLDDKILTSWNGLAIRGLARVGALLGEVAYVDAAVDAASFIEAQLVVDGVLHHTWKEGGESSGQARIPALLEDVAMLAVAYLDLYEVTGAATWFVRALELATDARERFRDAEGGGFFANAHDAQALYRRPKDSWDNAQPSGNSCMAEVGARLAGYTGDASWHDLADEVLRTFGEQVRRSPTGYGYLLQVMEFLRAGPRELAIVGEPGDALDALVATYRQELRPGFVLAVAAPGDAALQTVPLLEGRTPVGGHPAAYVCRDFVCERPVTGPADLREALAR